MIKLSIFVSVLYLAALSDGFSWDAYYDIDDIYAYLRSLPVSHPQNVELVIGGNSYEGRQILGVRIHDGTNSQTKKRVMIEGGLHAREWIAPATLTYFINQLLNGPSEIKNLKNAVDWYIFPSTNPDGYHYSFTKERLWRKSRSKSANGCYGVDLNRNWDYHWGTESFSKDPCDELLYIGTKPFSEIETMTLSNYIRSISPKLVGYVAFHSDEMSIYVPYSDSKVHIPDYKRMTDIGKEMRQYASKVNGTKFLGPATTEEISYGASGMSVDWVYQQFKTPMSYIVELRGNNFSWPADKISVQGDEVTQMMLGMITGAVKNNLIDKF